MKWVLKRFGKLENVREEPVNFEAEDGLRALDKRKYLMIIRDNCGYFCIKIYVVTPHLNCLVEMVQMRVKTYGFNAK